MRNGTPNFAERFFSGKWLPGWKTWAREQPNTEIELVENLTFLSVDSKKGDFWVDMDGPSTKICLVARKKLKLLQEYCNLVSCFERETDINDANREIAIAFIERSKFKNNTLDDVFLRTLFDPDMRFLTEDSVCGQLYVLHSQVAAMKEKYETQGYFSEFSINNIKHRIADLEKALVIKKKKERVYRKEIKEMLKEMGISKFFDLRRREYGRLRWLVAYDLSKFLQKDGKNWSEVIRGSLIPLKAFVRNNMKEMETQNSYLSHSSLTPARKIAIAINENSIRLKQMKLFLEALDTIDRPHNDVTKAIDTISDRMTLLAMYSGGSLANIMRLLRKLIWDNELYENTLRKHSALNRNQLKKCFDGCLKT